MKNLYQTFTAILLCSSAILFITPSAPAQGAWTQKANFGNGK